MIKSMMLSAVLLSGAAIAADQPELPPQASFGVKFCGQMVIWVILQNGKTYRVDQHTHPKKEDMAAFMAWLDTGNTDFVELPCPKGA